MWFVALFEALKEFFANLLPWSKRWANKLDAKDNKKILAEKNMDEAADKGDWDAYDKARADKHASD